MKIFCITVLIIIVLQSYRAEAQISGCTDPVAVNYDRQATINDGSCIYNKATSEPVASFILAGSLSETSGLLFWDNHLWTHNDNIDTNIYCLDTLNGLITGAYPLGGIINEDWEEISQDADYIYIGDIGNNSGNRENLRIFKVLKNSILKRSPVIDSITYCYSDQTDFTSPGGYNTDFDCEAFVVSRDSIYLFTKQWVNNKTSIYCLPNNPGDYTAKLKSTLDIGGLITGAAYMESERIIVLTGYSERLDPFIYILYDFMDHDFSGGNKRKIDLLLPYHQIEGIATYDGIKYYISNENFSPNPFVNINQKLHIFDLSPFLGKYLNLSDPLPDELNNYIVSPIPSHDFIGVRSLSEFLPADYSLISLSGQIVLSGKLILENTTISISGLNAGIYFLRIGKEKRHTYKVIKE